MPSSYWLKLYTEILDDPKIGLMPDWLFRRFIELLLVAKEYNKDGLLQPVPKLAWRIRLGEDQVEDALRALMEVGVVAKTPDGWLIVKFAERQKPVSGGERMRQYRKRNRNEPVTKSNHDRVTPSSSSSSSVSENQYESLYDSWNWVPSTPLEADKHPALVLFKTATGLLPGEGDWERAIGWIIQAGKKFHEHPDDLGNRINRAYLQLKGRKRQDGREYDACNVWWLEYVYNDTPLPKSTPPKGIKNEGTIARYKEEHGIE